MHPLGPASVVAFTIDGQGTYSLEALIEANTAPGVYCDPETIVAIRTLLPGEVYLALIGSDGGGGSIRIEAVESPGFEYMVWNETDDIPAAPDSFGSKAEAEEFIGAFRQRFEGQGYYKTSFGTRIPPSEVELLIEEAAI